QRRCDNGTPPRHRLQRDIHSTLNPAGDPDDLGPQEKRFDFRLRADDVHSRSVLVGADKILESLSIGSVAGDDEMQIGVEILQNIERPDRIEISFAYLNGTDTCDYPCCYR